MNSDVLNAFTVVVTQIFLGFYVTLLLDFREPVQTWRKRWICFISIVVAANVGLILSCGYWEVYTRAGIVTMTLPYVLLTMWCSRYKGLRVLFNLLTSLAIGCIGNTNGALAAALLPGFALIKPLTRAVSFLLLYLLLRELKQPYLRMLRLLDRGWGVLCMVPTTTFFTLVYITNHQIRTDPMGIMAVMYGFLIVCVYSYVLIYLFFNKVQQEYDSQRNNDLLITQVSALQGRLEAVRAADEAVRIERHDLRHKLQAVAAMVEKGEKTEALAYIGASQAHLDELKPVRWCQNPVLDAILASYFSQAERQGIQVEAALAIPDQLPVDAAELSTVFANALENAIHACAGLPEEKRKIICKCINQPRLMFEVANTCAGEVPLDENGMPVAGGRGHGIGTRSIAAFCENHGAVCSYKAEDGWFRMQVVL